MAGLTRFEGQARFQPLKFLGRMAEEVTVYEQTRVLRVEGNRVETARGSVTAEHIIFASHYPFINVPGFYFARMYQERSYVTALQGACALEGMYLGIDRDGLSFRSQGDVLLLSGGSHRTGRNRQGGQYEKLRSAARSFFPGSHEVAHWSAQDCMTPDQIPYIGRFSARRPDWYILSGFGKWGMTTAMAGARILSGGGNFFAPKTSDCPGPEGACNPRGAHGKGAWKAPSACGGPWGYAELSSYGLQAGVESGGGDLGLSLSRLPV